MTQPKSKQNEELDELLKIQVRNFGDLVKATSTSPYRQLMHLFATLLKVKTSKSHRSDIRSTFKHVLIHFQNELGNKPIHLENQLNEFSLDKFHIYLKDCMSKGTLHNRYANVLQSTYKNVLRQAIDLKTPNFSRFYLPSSFCYSTRVTARYKPYTWSERERIANAINDDINRITRLLKPYVKSCKGRPVVDVNGQELLKKKNLLDITDARWIFENHMNCTPMRSTYEFKATRVGRIFYEIIKANNLSYPDVYETWGVLCKVTVEHLLPFVLKLLQITGMNVESIYSLEVDDLIEKHPATGKPCLRYWKERSDGKKLYHLDIFKANLQWLTYSQGQEVKIIFDKVMKLTSYARSKAAPNKKNKLWLFESPNEEIKSLPSVVINIALKNFSKRYQLIDSSSEKKILETTRFRPTFISELIEKGVSIREIQLLMGHKHLYTTMRYLDIHDFGNIARTKIKDKLLQIHINAHSSVPHQSLSPPARNSEVKHVLSTPLASCKNVFDPPESVKRLKSYIPGKPCSTYNMCLSCPNVILSKTDLPKLFAMKRDYLVKIQNSRVLDTPFGGVIKSNLALLNTILDPEESDFDKDELIEAENLSLYVETAELI